MNRASMIRSSVHGLYSASCAHQQASKDFEPFSKESIASAPAAANAAWDSGLTKLMEGVIDTRAKHMQHVDE